VVRRVIRASLVSPALRVRTVLSVLLALTGLPVLLVLQVLTGLWVLLVPRVLKARLGLLGTAEPVGRFLLSSVT
jgi:hypothetical protein